MFDAASRLADLEQRGLRRRLAPLRSQGSRVDIGGRQLINFCSNDYLGLMEHPQVKAGAARAAQEFGGGSGSSRLISGDYPLLAAFEEELATWVGAEAALVVGSGYAANVGVLSSLPQRGDVVCSDALNHASIIDGCRLGRAEIDILPHGDLAAATAAFERHGARAFYAAESLYSMDGDIPPLPALLTAARSQGVTTIVDEAHALGVLGPEGRGLCYPLRGEAGGGPDVIIGTFGKALGSYGAFIAGSRDLRDLLLNTARSVIFSTSPAPAVIGAARAALMLSQQEPAHRETLLARAAQLRLGLGQLGYDLRGCQAQIVPVIIGEERATLSLAEGLEEDGFFARGIRPPTVPRGTSRIRLTVSALHTKGEIDALIDALDRRCRAAQVGPHAHP